MGMSVLPLLAIIGLTGLEILVAGLQAYVFHFNLYVFE